MKKILKGIMALTLLLSLTACGSAEGETTDPVDEGTKTLVVWSFTDELEKMINDYFIPMANPDFEIEFVLAPTDVYQTKIDPVLGSGKDAPDVFTMEAAFVKKYVDSGFLADHEQFGFDLSDTLSYTLDVATDPDGVLRGLSWQGTPGAFFYRRSMAEQYFGVSEPTDVQALVKDFPTFLDSARKIKEASNGEVYMLNSLGDLVQVFYASREQGWVVNDKLVIDPAIYDLLETAKVMEEEGLAYGADQWSEGWFAGMNTDTVFGYLLPTWGLHYVLKPNSDLLDDAGAVVSTTNGDWGMVDGPAGYFWGGTWVGVREGSEMSEEAAQLVEFLTLNEEFLTAWAKDTGDFVSNTKVVDAIKDSYSEEFLAGQNHYAQFASAAGKIDASILTGYDQKIQELLNDNAIVPYAKGEKDLDTAIEDFKIAVQNAYPEIAID